MMSENFYSRKDADGAANYLTQESVKRWQTEQGMVDDITIIVAYLHIEPKP